jgi:DNA polymerase III subunit gamma/tau
MSHQSLYRAYRPQSFKDVAGQEHIVGALSEQLASGRVAHAYLFAGSRGLGKTSVARIFAKELGVSDKDLYEIDAASNNSVEDIRALAENIYTLPFDSAKKLYILDEAHMLSKGAWNAFLKTLEEPPAHAVFILATTELSKVPETVQSRCQVFEFRKPTREGLGKLIASVAKKEGYELGAGVAELVAMLADGSYRDALSTLEKVFSVSRDKKISRTEAERATGAPRSELVSGFVSALHEGSAGEALVALSRANGEEVDMHMFLSLVLERARDILLARHAPGLRPSLKEEYGEEYAAIEKEADASDSRLTHTTLLILLQAAGRLRYAPIPVLPLELAVLELYGK